MRSPSCTISVAVAEKPPDTMPPVSGHRSLRPRWPKLDGTGQLLLGGP
jgi:hypothetical protein